MTPQEMAQAAMEKRKQKAEMRAQFLARRCKGLAQRHATKLKRIAEQEKAS